MLIFFALLIHYGGINFTNTGGNVAVYTTKTVP